MDVDSCNVRQNGGIVNVVQSELESTCEWILFVDSGSEWYGWRSEFVHVVSGDYDGNQHESQHESQMQKETRGVTRGAVE
jgi:hypothetical protein